MDLLISAFVALHIIGIAGLLGGYLTQLQAMGAGTARFTPIMLRGALTMLVTGFALVGLNRADDQTVSGAKIGVKLALLVVILGLVYVKRDEEQVKKAFFGAGRADGREHLHRDALDVTAPPVRPVPAHQR